MSASIQLLKRTDVLENSRPFAMAMQQGFCYLEIPEEIKPLIPHGMDFGNTFYQDPKIQQVSLGGLNGFHRRDGVQVESFYLERKHWAEIFSSPLAHLAQKMEALAVEVLCGVLRELKIDDQNGAIATGGASEGQGMTHFTFNHYRPEAGGNGLKTHRDFGHVTVLFIHQKGLQALIEKEWRDVEPKEGYFVVNFGATLQLLRQDPDQLTAAVHRVVKVAQDRISFGIFLDSTMESAIYKANGAGDLEKLEMSFGQYVQSQFKIAYDETTGEFDADNA